jgi:hypothetical protein
MTNNVPTNLSELLVSDLSRIDTGRLFLTPAEESQFDNALANASDEGQTSAGDLLQIRILRALPRFSRTPEDNVNRLRETASAMIAVASLVAKQAPGIDLLTGGEVEAADGPAEALGKAAHRIQELLAKVAGLENAATKAKTATESMRHSFQQLQQGNQTLIQEATRLKQAQAKTAASLATANAEIERLKGELAAKPAAALPADLDEQVARRSALRFQEEKDKLVKQIRAELGEETKADKSAALARERVAVEEVTKSMAAEMSYHVDVLQALGSDPAKQGLRDKTLVMIQETVSSWK